MTDVANEGPPGNNNNLVNISNSSGHHLQQQRQSYVSSKASNNNKHSTMAALEPCHQLFGGYFNLSEPKNVEVVQEHKNNGKSNGFGERTSPSSSFYGLYGSPLNDFGEAGKEELGVEVDGFSSPTTRHRAGESSNSVQGLSPMLDFG
jgi:hypothetical protein